MWSHINCQINNIDSIIFWYNFLLISYNYLLCFQQTSNLAKMCFKGRVLFKCDHCKSSFRWATTFHCLLTLSWKCGLWRTKQSRFSSWEQLRQNATRYHFTPSNPIWKYQKLSHKFLCHCGLQRGCGRHFKTYSRHNMEGFFLGPNIKGINKVCQASLSQTLTQIIVKQNGLG